jgi:putative dehydrogenase
MSFHVTVVGIGAMGGGMARALLASDAVAQLVGYDRSTELVQALFEEAKEVNKAPTVAHPPTCLEEAISVDTNVVLLVLVNESQCEQVCFGSNDEKNLLHLLSADSYVILCSTVTPTWARHAEARFRAASIHFVDCPISGGPVRARAGDLTLMVSSQKLHDDADQQRVHDAVWPILQALARHVHVIRTTGNTEKDGVGMASTAKMVHQLLAGVHICAAAEALALAAKAGLDPHQVYEIVNGAAGASWMFQDRGARMLKTEERGADGVPVMSALEIFVKDLDIVYSEAKGLQSPIPVASAALQQFICGQGLGLSRSDDSQVVKVYENITGVPVGSSSTRKEGSQVGEYWKMADGTLDEIVEVGSEPRHKIVLSNDYVRVLRVSFPPNDTTLAHRHAEDSLYFFLVNVENGLTVVNHVQGRDPQCDCMGFGEVRMGLHKTEGPPLVHKITNTSSVEMLCIDAEVLRQPPVTAAIPLLAKFHECIKTRDKCRVYRLVLEPGESVTVTYAFFHLTVVMKPSIVEKSIGGGAGAGVRWTTSSQVGDVAWHEPVTDLTQSNVGVGTYKVFIAEWR